jgi:hypothetical protein
MKTWIIGICVATTVGLTGCSLSPSQRWGATAVGYEAGIRVVTANADRLSDETLRDVYEVAKPAKAYLDRSYEILTDGDPSNDDSAVALIEVVERDVLPILLRAGKEVK